MDSHSKIKCGRLLNHSNLRNISLGMPLMGLSNPLISNNPPINHHHNSANQEAPLRCSQPCSIQACKEWVRAIPHQAVVFTNLIKVLSSSCSQIHLALSLALRAGQRSSHLEDLVEIGATSREPSKFTNHYVLRTEPKDEYNIHGLNVLCMASRLPKITICEQITHRGENNGG